MAWAREMGKDIDHFILRSGDETTTLQCTLFFSFFFQVQPYNRKYRSIGHRVWSMLLNILTELSVNSFNEKHNSAEPLAHAQSVIVMQF